MNSESVQQHPREPAIRDKVYSGVLWSIAQSWGAQAMNLLVVIVLARLLEPEMFGLIALASVFVSLVKSYVDQGLGTAIVQRHEIDPRHLDAVFWASGAIGLLCTGLGIALAPLVAALFKNPELTPIIRMLSVIFVIDAISTVQLALLKRRMEFRAIAIRSLLSVGVGGAAGVTLAILGFGATSLVAQQVVASIVGVAVVWTAVEWRPRLRFSRAHALELAGFGYNILGIRLLTFVTRRADDLLIGYFLGTVALGYYTIAYKLYKVLLDILASVVSRVALPALSKLQIDKEAFVAALTKSTSLVSAIAFPCFLATSIMAGDVVEMLFGSQWLPAVPLVRVLAIAGLAQSITLIFQQGFIAFGKPDLIFRIMVLTTAAMLGMFMIAVRQGVEAVALAFAVVSCGAIPAQMFVLRRLMGFGYGDLFRALRPVLVGVVAGLPLMLIWLFMLRDSIVWLRVIGASSLGIAVYVTVMGRGYPDMLRNALGPLLRRARAAPTGD